MDVQNLAWQAQINRLKAQDARFTTFQRSKSDENETSESAADIGPPDREETWRLWAAPGKRRAQFQVGQELVEVVIEGSTFWSNARGRSITNDGNTNRGHGQGNGHHLIRTAEYTDLIQVIELSDGVRRGRPTIEAEVTTLDREHRRRGPGLHGLTIGDPEILELSVDRERGVVLKASSLFQGAIYRIVEVTEVEFDPHLDIEIFTIEPEFSTERDST
jgi:hypothetical protein